MRLDYNNARGGIDRTVYIHLYDPRRVADMDTLLFYDRAAQDRIQTLKAALETVERHRLDLMERAQYLATQTGTLSIELHRRRTYSGKVEYYLQFVRTYEDGSSHTEKSTKYSGKERHKAVAGYKAALKAHPGAPCVLDIEKGKWER